MYKGPFKKFFLGRTTHLIPKIMTLAVSSTVLVAMINIDASASAFGGGGSNSVRTSAVNTLTSEKSNSQFSGLVKRWEQWAGASTVLSPAKPASTTTIVGGSSGGGGGGGASVTITTTSQTTTTTPLPTTTTSNPPSTTTTNPPSTSTAVVTSTTSGPITAGPSRSQCLIADPVANSLSSVQSAVTTFDNQTGTKVTCLGEYLNSAVQWSDWSNPWIVGSSGSGFTQWVAQDPQVRQLVLQVNLIPLSLENVNNPLGWEQSCANGNFNSYATTLGNNLVAAGLQNSVLRLGAEMNGEWEADFVGTTLQEQHLWATCFDNEVTALRQAAGEHFLIDWNPCACTEPYPWADYYPGNAYVDILGLDFYNLSCDAPNTPVNYSQLSSVPAGLNSFESFADAQGKPMSFPEWGLTTSPNGDDPAYIDGVGATIANNDFSFEAYFNIVNGGTMPLGANTPLSLVEFRKWFG